MKILGSLLLTCFFYSATAKTYYFSSSSGDDSRSSSQAQSSSTPWKSINKLNAIFSSLQPGDQILFKKGDVFVGTINMTTSGSSSSPIVLGAYGSGSNPMITSLVTLSSWSSTNYSGVYESGISGLSSSRVMMVLLNGSQKGMGRFPNANASNSGYLTLESHSGNNSITDKELSSSPNWKGGEVVIRTNRWTIDRSFITGHSGNTLYYNTMSQPARDGYGYFIQSHIQTLDQLGEWYYNQSTKKMDVYFGGSPSNYKLQVATLDNLLKSNYVNYIRVENLDFKGSNGDAIYCYGGTGITVRNCNVSFSGADGVYASGLNFLIEGSSVENSNNDGVNISNGSNAKVRNCVVKNSYTIPGLGQSGNGQGAGVRNCSGGVVEYNQIINTGYVGVELGGDNSVIQYNLIDHFAFIKDDCGGIYTSNGQNKTNSGRKIIGNIILNGSGAPDGTNAPGTSSADGIYLDDNVNGIDIRDNTAASCNKGIYVHNSRNLNITGNTFYNCISGQIYMKHDNLGDPIRNVKVLRNIFFSKEYTQLASSFMSTGSDLGSMGVLDSNYYARPIDDNTTIYSSYVNSSGSRVNTLYDLQGWSSLYSYDKSSKKSAKEICNYFITSLLGSNKTPWGSISSSSDIQKIWPNSASVSWSSSAGLDGGCAKVSPSANGASIVVGVGSLSSSKKYVLRYSVKGTGTFTLGAYLRSSLYKPLTPLKYWTTSTSRSNNEMLFQPEQNEASGAIVFTIDTKTAFYIDNIQVYEASGSATNPDDSLKFVYNASSSSKSFSLGDNYVDVKSNKYSGSITLKPYTSAVLIHDGGTSTSTNSAPTVSITSPKASTTFSDPASVNIVASANDADGSISKVEFYQGSTLIKTENTAPYDWTWTNLKTGSYTVTAKAYDNSGNTTTSSPVTFSVGTSTTTSSSSGSVSVGITSPKSNGTYTNSVQLTANASSSDGSISKVEFYNGSKLITTEKYAPYDWTWTNVSEGKYTVTAKAYDSKGNIATSTSVSFTVGSAPSVTITSPRSNSTYSTSPTSVQLTANASDDGSITKVEFYNGSKLITTEKYAPYDWTWNNVAAGKYTITAKAYDNNGNSTTSSPVTFSVGGGAPTVSITSPKANATYDAPASVQLTANASDDGSIAKVEFYEGSTLITTERYAPYDWTWKDVVPGTHTIVAKATDNNGKVTTSSSVTFYINGSPSVTLTSPQGNSSYEAPASIRLTANASDNGNITKVEFYNGNKLITTENNAPYDWTWYNVAAGTYTITAVAYDDKGNTTTSSSSTVTVKSVGNPTVVITSPVTGGNYSNSVRLTANASDPGGSVSKVEFYNGSKLITTEYNAPYDWTWNNVGSGSYTITAKAYDNSGNTTVSAPAYINVGASSVANSTTSAGTDLPATNSSQILPSEFTQFKLYPNPARDYMNVAVGSEFSMGEKISLTILNVSGATMMQSTLNVSSTSRVDITKLAPGAYILRLSNQTKSVAKQFIKTQ